MTAAEQPFYLFTSVPPRLSGDELQHQREIILSWRAAGFTPVTVNGPGEITQIADYDLGIAIESVSDNGKSLVCDILPAVRRRGPINDQFYYPFDFFCSDRRPNTRLCQFRRRRLRRLAGWRQDFKIVDPRRTT
jgi:hypothetical protein